MLYMTFPELIYSVTGSSYFFTLFIHFSHPLPPAILIKITAGFLLRYKHLYVKVKELA